MGVSRKKRAGHLDDLAATLAPALLQLAGAGRLQAMSAAAMAVTDGLGAGRVADALLALAD
jgi:hypothetical protein